RHRRDHLHRVAEVEARNASADVVQRAGIGHVNEQRIVAVDLDVRDAHGLPAGIYHGPVLGRQLHDAPAAGHATVADQDGALGHPVGERLGARIEHPVRTRVDQEHTATVEHDISFAGVFLVDTSADGEHTGEGDVVLDGG